MACLANGGGRYVLGRLTDGIDAVVAGYAGPDDLRMIDLNCGNERGRRVARAAEGLCGRRMGG